MSECVCVCVYVSVSVYLYICSYIHMHISEYSEMRIVNVATKAHFSSDESEVGVRHEVFTTPFTTDFTADRL